MMHSKILCYQIKIYKAFYEKNVLANNFAFTPSLGIFKLGTVLLITYCNSFLYKRMSLNLNAMQKTKIESTKILIFRAIISCIVF